MSVSKRDLKFVLRIQDLGPFRYTLLSIPLKSYPLSSCVCVCVKKYLVFSKEREKEKKKEKN